MGIGELGISLGDPDDWALDVLGDILNSFGGRLFDRIRSREVQLHLHTLAPGIFAGTVRDSMPATMATA